MSDTLLLGRLAGGVDAYAIRGADGWGIALRGQGRLAASQPWPVQAEIWTTEAREHACAYHTLESEGTVFIGQARLELGGGAALAVVDHWSVAEGLLLLRRRVSVEGEAPGGFGTAFTLSFDEPLGWPDVDAFAPGMIYGWSDHIAQHAIGSIAHYLQGVRSLRIREDRLPAPLFGVDLRDGSSLTVYNAAPHGDTTRADSDDREGEPLVDDAFAFAALGGEERAGRLAVGMWFPGTEGEITYLNTTPFSDGEFGNNVRRRWRRRYHPLRPGRAHEYQLAIRCAAGERPQSFRREAWRQAWRLLDPQIVPQDLDMVRASLAEALERSIEQVEDRAGPAHVLDSVSGRSYGHPAIMGFTGRAVETGELLLREAQRLAGPEAERRRERAITVLETFARLPVAPPLAEGLDLKSGRLTSGVRPNFFVRALGEGGKSMLRAYLGERSRGVEHTHWLRWCIDLADWLLTQERPGGGFPRAWRDGTAEVVKPDPRSSYAIVPFLVELTRATGDEHYLGAALRAAELCWALDGSRGYFIGGTLDNANVVDKEAGTLSLEAFLALFEATGDQRWLSRAQDAGDFAETWIYLWAVPMAPGEPDDGRHWKEGISTVGLQLIATGHSLVDQYMTWDVVSYARLYRYTGDGHYLDVARLLLHNTKTMLALPGRTFGLYGPGFQQEHWSVAVPRGYGVHRHWLPWVSCSHLEGLLALEAFDGELFELLAARVKATV